MTNKFENADDNAALAMEQKMRADKLEAKLQENLEKAYEHNEDECKRCMAKVEVKQSLLLEETEKRVRQDTAIEIFSELFSKEDFVIINGAQSIPFVEMFLIEQLAQKYGVEVEE